jgi:hypothetical protein
MCGCLYCCAAKHVARELIGPGGEIPDLPKRARTCQIVAISIGGMGLRPQAKSMRTARAPLAELIFDMRLHAGRVGSE